MQQYKLISNICQIVIYDIKYDME